MANPQRGEVRIDVEGVSYTLKPTFNALCAVEERTGKTIADIATAASGQSLLALRQLIWSYLQAYHAAEITSFEQAGDWIQRAGGLSAVQSALAAVQAANAPDDPVDPQTAQAGTGVDSPWPLVGSV